MAGNLALSKELWLEIMSCLDYFELKKCMRVSKAFKAFTALPACQETMFRSKNIIREGSAINLANIRLHPAFDYMSFECATKIEHVFFFTNDYNDTDALTDTCAAKEYATDPPVAFIRLQIHCWPPVQVTNKSGVTVEQVMKALCRFFSKGDHREVMGDHTGWTGWDETKLDGKGCLLLRAMWFDS
ncbi:hypothetical protein QM012_001138 [Aureobasidium pullulans]|uniref:F-box domain-containing protein n=1 Tax=Aureobasidium pullulans TaxID=5580 RepID=A0ABR0TFT6_AURPU